MDTIDSELKKNGINVLFPIDTKNVNNIANYVAKTLYFSFPELKLDYNTLFSSISRLNMFIADMPQNMSGASYYYKNSTIYFRNGLSLNMIKKLAVHECIHHFQEIKDSKGKLHRLGLCTYQGIRGYGNALNEAAVQLMSAHANKIEEDKVTYYGINLSTPSPDYYPLLCNLIRQIGYLTGFSVLFESTFFANDAFFDKLKSCIGENKALTIQENFEKILIFENKINELTQKNLTEDLSYNKFKKSTDKIAKYKKEIQDTFLGTQNLIISSFFDNEMPKLKNASQIEDFRRYLYSFNNLIGTTPTYSFFNDYYIRKMSELDDIYQRISNPGMSIAVQKRSKISIILETLKKIFMKNASEYENEINK